MKKIVGIIAALALAGSVFADPDIVPAQTEFKGDASLEWIADLDNETTGMKNSESASFKIKFIKEGTRETSGDGLWGELKIKAGNVEVAGGNNAFGMPSPTVETAKIHFVDGDMYFNMDIRVPDFSVGKLNYVRALKYTTPRNNWEDPAFAAVGGGYEYVTGTADEEAEIVFVTNIPNPDSEDPEHPNIEIKTGVKAKTGKKTESKGKYQGFTLNFGIPLVDLSLAFGDNGQQKAKDKEFAYKAAVTVKPIDGLNIYAGLTGCTADAYKDLAIAFTTSYNYKIDDQFYVKPALQFTMVGKAMGLGAGAFFGWGSEGQSWSHDFLLFDKTNINVCDNEARAGDGLSVVFIKPLKDAAGNTVKTSSLLIEAYDAKLLSGLEIGTVKIGAAYRAENTDKLGKGAIAFGAIYDNTFDIVYITTKASFGMDLAADKDNTGFKWSFRVGTKELVANTDVYAEYAAGYSKYSAKDDLNKGKVTIGTKISF